MISFYVEYLVSQTFIILCILIFVNDTTFLIDEHFFPYKLWFQRSQRLIKKNSVSKRFILGQRLLPMNDKQDKQYLFTKTQSEEVYLLDISL